MTMKINRLNSPTIYIHLQGTIFACLIEINLLASIYLFREKLNRGLKNEAEELLTNFLNKFSV